MNQWQILLGIFPVKPATVPTLALNMMTVLFIVIAVVVIAAMDDRGGPTPA